MDGVYKQLSLQLMYWGGNKSFQKILSACFSDAYNVLVGQVTESIKADNADN